MRGTLIWDLPTRLFHWLFAGGFIAAAVIALGLGDDSPLFPYHGIIGLVLGLVIGLRLIWGFIGSRHARFRSFAYGPGAVASYLLGIVTGRGGRHPGHNPASAYAALAMFAITAGLAATGVMLARGNESVKEVHELLVYSMIAVASVHVLGVIVHTLRHRDSIAASMVHGRKRVEASAGIRTPRPLAAAVFLLIVGAWAATLVTAYDPGTQSITAPAMGTRLQLGDAHKDGAGARHRDGD
ncbi:MAG: cytochrome b/b6 domain-containing protein [Phycisphaerales bacterium]|nr:cytochrome b/b6 domain-containing protein [Phycisphaerales bacterium]